MRFMGRAATLVALFGCVPAIAAAQTPGATVAAAPAAVPAATADTAIPVASAAPAAPVVPDRLRLVRPEEEGRARAVGRASLAPL